MKGRGILLKKLKNLLAEKQVLKEHLLQVEIHIEKFTKGEGNFKEAQYNNKWSQREMLVDIEITVIEVTS